MKRLFQLAFAIATVLAGVSLTSCNDHFDEVERLDVSKLSKDSVVCTILEGQFTHLTLAIKVPEYKNKSVVYNGAGGRTPKTNTPYSISYKRGVTNGELETERPKVLFMLENDKEVAFQGKVKIEIYQDGNKLKETIENFNVPTKTDTYIYLNPDNKTEVTFYENTTIHIPIGH